jgi:nucleoside-diphosphate-sugar epimerase
VENPILITGGTGLIGRRAARFLVESDHSVVLYDVIPPESDLLSLQEAFPDRVEFVLGDVLTMGRLGAVVRDRGIRKVIHLGGLLGSECNADAELATKVNVEGTVNVLELARLFDLERVLVASTTSVYGLESQYATDQLPLAEGAPALLAPHSPIYAGTKLYMEKLSEHYRNRFGVKAYGLRPSTVYGYGRRSGGFKWLSDLITTAATGGAVTVPHGNAKVNIIYVDDVAAQFALLLDAPESAFDPWPFLNSGGDICTLGELGELLRHLVPEADVTIDPEGIVEHAYDFAETAIAEATGYRRRYSPLEAGVRAHVNTARATAGLPPVAEPATV